MANVARVAAASMDASNGMFAEQITGNLYAGEDLAAVAPCYIKSDGKVYMSDGSGTNETSRVDGWTPVSAKAGMAITLFRSGRFKYGAALTPGAPLYLSADTAGLLGDAPLPHAPAPVARAINTKDIMVLSTANAPAANVFYTAERTATGSSEDIAHPFGRVPLAVFVIPTDTSPTTAGVFTVTEGTHTDALIKITVTSGKKYKVLALF